MLCWYLNSKAGIYFDKIPSLCVRYYVPSMTKEEKKSVEKYPFACKNDLKVCLKDIKKNKEYNFCIPKGYCYDGASVPKFFWRVIGSNSDNRFLVPALIHDFLCENHNCIDNNKSFSTDVFNALLESSGVCKVKRFFMKNSVAFYQTMFCNWE